jgi:hypothetical protein
MGDGTLCQLVIGSLLFVSIVLPKLYLRLNYHTKTRCTIAFPVICLSSYDNLDPLVPFDSNSIPVRVDNCCSYSISPHLGDFVGPLTPSDLQVNGMFGKASIIQKGTICWTIQDDEGVSRDIFLPGSLYIPESPTCLLSPQHWAQTAREHKPDPHGTWCAT